jgi:hypothetical protein
LFEAIADGRYRLFAGKNQFDLAQEGSAHRIQSTPSSVSANDILKSWLGSVRQKQLDEQKRGFCISQVVFESP